MATNAYRMTITVPQDVKEQMDQVNENVNWSAVAAEAFRRKVVEVRTRRTKTMTKANLIERLRAAGRADPYGFEAGHAHGRKWAEEKALPRYLRALAEGVEDAFAFDCDPEDPQQTPFRNIGYKLARRIRDDGTDWEGFWKDAIGAGGTSLIQKEEFAQGFVAGAVEVWEEVKDEL